MTIQPGTKIGKYQILKLIGRGGMAEVYLARHMDLDMDVAIKLIRAERFPPEILQSVVKRFQNEAKKMAQLSHPNIVRVIDYGTYQGVPYFVMDFLPGGTLKRYLGKPMPYQQAAKLLMPISRALAYAHANGVIHRDVKPANILIGKNGELLLSDFGVAKVMDSEQTQGLTATGASIGTPEYMAPEQAVGKAIDYRVDIYSLGVILYELVTGRRPFIADTPMAVIIKQMRDPLPQPSRFVQGLPEKVEHILYKALAKDPKERYQNMIEFSEDLEKYSVSQLQSKIEEELEINKPTQKKEEIIYQKRPDVKEKNEQKNISRKFEGWPIILLFISIVVLIIIIKSINSSKITSVINIEATNHEEIIAGVNKSKVSAIDNMTLMYVPAGEFLMGSTENDINAEEDEFPQHKVYLDAFWIDQTEVTNAQYRLCVEAGNCQEPEITDFYNSEKFTKHPVVYVSWNDAQGYCEWAGRRLPTEAEWEKAARGTEGQIYPWGDDSPDNDFLNYYRNIGNTTVVGRYTLGVSPYGLFDMAGNVWEWVADWYGAGYYGNSPTKNPDGPDSGALKVLRGGSWNMYTQAIRSAERFNYNPNIASGSALGFRCALSK